MLTNLVNLLPAAAQPWAKGIVSALVAVVTVAAALGSVVTGLPSWVAVVVAALSPLLVAATPAPGYGQTPPAVPDPLMPGVING